MHQDERGGTEGIRAQERGAGPGGCFSVQGSCVLGHSVSSHLRVGAEKKGVGGWRGLRVPRAAGRGDEAGEGVVGAL